MNFKNIILKIISVALVIATLIGISVSSFAATDVFKKNNIAQTAVPADDEVIVDESEIVDIPEKIVEIARSKIGYYPSNINEFTTWYYGWETDAYWCSIFVSWCANEAGALGTAIPKRSSVGVMRDWFNNKGQFYPATSDYIPQKGDILFLNTANDGTDDVHHVDIVTETGFITINKKAHVKCIGGNTSDLNYNGSEYVTEKTRPVESTRATIVGYAHPDYASSQGLMGSLYTLADKLSPSFVKYLYSKVISFLPKLSVVFEIFKILFTYEPPVEPVVPTEPVA